MAAIKLFLDPAIKDMFVVLCTILQVCKMLSVLSLLENTIEGLYSRGQKDSPAGCLHPLSSLALLLTVRSSVWDLKKTK